MLKKADQPIRWKERIGTVVVGHVFKKIETSTFDYVLYPAAISLLGTLFGGLVMTTASAMECLFLIRVYDWMGRDWLGYEAVKTLRDGEERPGRFFNFFQQVARKSDWLAFFVFSVFRDPFETTVYMRRGAYNGMSKRDWWIFGASVLVGNLWWTTVVTFAVAGVRIFLQWLRL